MSETDGEVPQLAERIRALEDEREIAWLISSYGPAVDSGQSEKVGQIWTETGVYDTDAIRNPPGVWRGRAEIGGMVEGAFHQGLIAQGAAHVLGVPTIRLNGDHAVATCYSRVFRNDPEGYVVWRVSANRWELVRTPEGWRAAYRTTRMLNGSAEARALLGRAGED